jgi:hypothetical protein
MFISDLFEDTSLGLELEKIKEKIAQLYNQMIEKVYKLENPGATPEEIEMFLEENKLEFSSDDTVLEEEITSLEDMLEDLLDPTDDLDPVKDMSYTKPTVQIGKELKSKTNSKGDIPKTVKLPDPKGLMATPNDSRKVIKTKKVEIQTGKQKVSMNHSKPDFSNMSPLVEQIKSNLLSLRERQIGGRQRMEDRL